MNCTVYLFGAEAEGNNSRIYQYPNDYAIDIFRRFENQLQSDTLLTLYRNDNLAYHIYLKKVDNGYIGLCASFNSVWVNSSKDLLKVFDEAFVDIVAQGVFVKVTDQGRLLSRASQLVTRIQEAKEICSRFVVEVSRLEHRCKQLPPVNVAIDANVLKQLPNQASDEEWKQAIESYRFIFANYSNSETCGGFYVLLEKIKFLSGERDEYRNYNVELKEQCNQIERQKKQYKTVIILFLLLLIGGVITAVSISKKNDNINSLQDDVESLNFTIERLNMEIQNKTESLAIMTENKNRLEQTVQQKNNEIDKLESDIGNIGCHYPIVINKVEIANVDYSYNVQTDYGRTIYSSQTMFIRPKVYYTGVSNGSHVLKVKFFTPDGLLSRGDSSPSGCSYSESHYVYLGENTLELNGWGGSTRGHWKSGTYRIEIWYNDVCLKATTFNIY